MEAEHNVNVARGAPDPILFESWRYEALAILLETLREVRQFAAEIDARHPEWEEPEWNRERHEALAAAYEHLTGKQARSYDEVERDQREAEREFNEWLAGLATQAGVGS